MPVANSRVSCDRSDTYELNAPPAAQAHTPALLAAQGFFLSGGGVTAHGHSCFGFRVNPIP